MNARVVSRSWRVSSTPDFWWVFRPCGACVVRRCLRNDSFVAAAVGRQVPVAILSSRFVGVVLAGDKGQSFSFVCWVISLRTHSATNSRGGGRSSSIRTARGRLSEVWWRRRLLEREWSREGTRSLRMVRGLGNRSVLLVPPLASGFVVPTSAARESFGGTRGRTTLWHGGVA